MRAAAFWDPLEAGLVRCRLCPHACALSPGKSGLCRIRRNEAGSLRLTRWGEISALALDPIEKKPLYHFLPGTRVFSVGFWGCNLRCPFCQNWEISQTEGEEGWLVRPDELVSLALASQAPSLAFTYSEPLVHMEYLLEASTLAQEAGLRTVLVSNGCVSREAAEALLPHLDAANIDLKAAKPEAYARELGGDGNAVRRFIEMAADRIHLEICTLVVPGLENWEASIDELSSFLAELSPDIPYHLSAAHPAYRFKGAPTDPGLLAKLKDSARKRLRYVYLGNVSLQSSDSHCPSCGTLLVARRGFQAEVKGLLPTEAHGKTGNTVCPGCGTALPFRL